MSCKKSCSCCGELEVLRRRCADLEGRVRIAAEALGLESPKVSPWTAAPDNQKSLKNHWNSHNQNSLEFTVPPPSHLGRTYSTVAALVSAPMSVVTPKPGAEIAKM